MTRALALLLVAACGRIGFAPPLDAATGDAAAGPHSGTRLKLVHADLADGARQEVGIYDSLRGERCAPATLADGNAYCAPVNLASPEYADAGCTQLVAVGTGGCEQGPRYVVEQDACFGSLALYPVAGPSAATAYYTRGLDGCVGPFSSGSGSIFAVGPVLAATDLARLVLGPLVGVGRLAARSDSSADGLVIAGPPYDTAIAATCAPDVDASGARSCLRREVVPAARSLVHQLAPRRRVRAADGRRPRRLPGAGVRAVRRRRRL